MPVAGGIDLDLPGDGVRLRASRWPGGHRDTPVLLLHGLASQRRFWNLVVPGLAGLPVIALDQRGHGDSEQPEAGYDTATVVRDALTALDALALSRVVVVGHSWGASTALTFAADHPDRTLAVVALDGGFTSLAEWGPRERTRALLEPPQWSGPPEAVPTLLRHGPLGPWWSAGVEQALLPLFGVGADGLARARLPFDLHMAVVDALLDYRPADVLPRIDCPAWLVACELAGSGDGGAGPDTTRRTAAGLDAAGHLLRMPRLFRWGGALHDVPLQWPALVAGCIRAAAVEAAGAPAARRPRASE